ncbi:MAG: amidohydrolase family protein [Oscillospiraceae bacterium]
MPTIREQALAGQPLDCFVLDAHTHLGGYYKKGWFQPPTLADTAHTLSLTARFGTDCLITAPHPLIFGDMEMANAAGALAAEKNPGVIYCYLIVCPQQGLASLKKQLKKYADCPFFVGLKFLGGYHGSYSQKEYQYALDFAEERSCPVLCHTWGNDPPWEEFAEILRNYHRLSLIAAHLGGGSKEMAIRFSSLIQDYPNFYMDICGQIENELSDEDAVHLIGASRLIYGTDLINLNPCIDFGRLAFSNLPDKEKQMIFGENFLTLQKKSSMGKVLVPRQYQIKGD